MPLFLKAHQFVQLRGHSLALRPHASEGWNTPQPHFVSAHYALQACGGCRRQQVLIPRIEVFARALLLRSVLAVFLVLLVPLVPFVLLVLLAVSVVLLRVAFAAVFALF